MYINIHIYCICNVSTDYYFPYIWKTTSYDNTLITVPSWSFFKNTYLNVFPNKILSNDQMPYALNVCLRRTCGRGKGEKKKENGCRLGQKACTDCRSAVKDHLSLHRPRRLVSKHGRRTHTGIACSKFKLIQWTLSFLSYFLFIFLLLFQTERRRVRVELFIRTWLGL